MPSVLVRARVKWTPTRRSLVRPKSTLPNSMTRGQLGSSAGLIASPIRCSGLERAASSSSKNERSCSRLGPHGGLLWSLPAGIRRHTMAHPLRTPTRAMDDNSVHRSVKGRTSLHAALGSCSVKAGYLPRRPAGESTSIGRAGYPRWILVFLAARHCKPACVGQNTATGPLAPATNRRPSSSPGRARAPTG